MYSTEANNWYLAAPFVNQLKNTNDPRLKSKSPLGMLELPLVLNNQQIKPIGPALQFGCVYGLCQWNDSCCGKSSRFGQFLCIISNLTVPVL
ncbi:MAG: hypothetical protein IPO04_10750 [Cytophagaceae bacterium]|nr:hypothetical protein [Cytophagaceae bacterium]